MYGHADLDDIPFVLAFLIGGIVSTGIGTISLFGTKFSSTLTSVVGFNVSIALVLSIVGFGGIYLTNQIDYSKLQTEQQALVTVSLALTILLQWVDELHNAVTGSDILGVIVLGILSAGAGVLSYLG